MGQQKGQASKDSFFGKEILLGEGRNSEKSNFGGPYKVEVI